jgi:integrase
MYSLCARSFAMPAVEVGALRASPNPSTHLGSTLTKICRKGRRGKTSRSWSPALTAHRGFRAGVAARSCFARYGLRVGEVCRLRLEDIDWAEEKICVRRSKQRKVQTYPLTTEVGNALLRYLKEARPRCSHREVLLTLRRPYRPVSVAALSTMTQKLQKRLGLKLKRYGSHVLRHYAEFRTMPN